MSTPHREPAGYRATFTTSSPLYPCEHRACGRVSTTPPMRCAWIPYEPTPPGMQPRRACWHLCPTHSAEWEREGIPAFALEWHRDHGGDVLALLGSEPVAKGVTSEVKANKTAQQPSAQRELFG